MLCCLDVDVFFIVDDEATCHQNTLAGLFVVLFWEIILIYFGVFFLNIFYSYEMEHWEISRTCN